MRYCSTCGAKLPDGARFCTSCGTRVEGTPVDRAAPAGTDYPLAAPSASERAAAGASADVDRPAGLGARVLQFRRTALAAVPAWALALLALLLAAGTAYAVYKAVTVWVLPALEQEEEVEEAEEVDETEEEAVAEEEEAEPTEEELALAAYEEIIAEYTEAFSQIDQVGEWESVDVDDSFPEDAVVSEYWQNDVYSEYPHISSAVVSETWSFYENLYYCLIDIDGNGVSELIFSCGDDAATGAIDAAFTYADGQLVMLFDGWDRAYYWLCEDGTIGYMSRGGVSRYFYRYFELEGGTLTVVEEISQESDYDWENLIYSHTVDGVVVEEGSEPYDSDDGDTVLAVVAAWIEEAQQTHVERELIDWVQLV